MAIPTKYCMNGVAIYAFKRSPPFNANEKRKNGMENVSCILRGTSNSKNDDWNQKQISGPLDTKYIEH